MNVDMYIALLRGVNVGGKNKIPMPALREALEEVGLQNVSTYINSGNILFHSEETDIEALQRICHKTIMDTFALDIAVAVIAADALAEALDHAPDWWNDGSESKHNTIFVIAPAQACSVIEGVGTTKPDYERVEHYGSLIFWSAPLQTFSRTRWSKIVSTSAYKDVTIRNANTTLKLHELSRRERA